MPINNLSYNGYKRKKFCSSSCSASYNNKGIVHNPPKIRNKNCINCGRLLERHSSSFCSNKCQQDYNYKEYINRWKNGEESGTTGEAWIDLSSYVRRYLFEKYDNKCSVCGWSKTNPYTGKLPLEVEHIDGDATNNKEENLTLLCPNCHSLTKTYRGANKGHGTRDIKWVSRNGTTNINK